MRTTQEIRHRTYVRVFQKSTELWLVGDPDALPGCWPAAEGALGRGGEEERLIIMDKHSEKYLGFV